MTIIPIAKTIRKLSPYPVLSITLYVLFYFFCSSFNTPRQFIAMAIIVWSSHFIFEKKFWKYLFFVSIATLFHTSAVIFIGLYFIGRIRINNKTKLIMGLFSVLMIMFGGRLSTILLGLWPRFSIYIGYGGGSAISDLVVQILSLLLLERIRPTIETEAERQKFHFFYMCTFFAIMMSAMASVNILFARLEAYFYIFSIFAIPFGIYHVRRNKILCYFIFLFLGILICVRYLLNNNCGVVPYQLSPLIGL